MEFIAIEFCNVKHFEVEIGTNVFHIAIKD
jgi:hypothetical protein